MNLKKLDQLNHSIFEDVRHRGPIRIIHKLTRLFECSNYETQKLISRMKKMTTSFSIRNGVLCDGSRNAKTKKTKKNTKTEKNKPIEHHHPHEIDDQHIDEYISATANQQSWVDQSIYVDEVENPSLFSSTLERQYMEEMDNQNVTEFEPFPSFEPFEPFEPSPYNHFDTQLNASSQPYDPTFQRYEEDFFHANNCLDPPEDSQVFHKEILRAGTANIFDPNNNAHYVLCKEWIQRNEKGLRKIYFSNLPVGATLTVDMVIPLYTRYHGRDSIIMRLTCLEWPIYLTDPTGIKTFKDCIRPPWLLDYIYTIMLSSIQLDKYFNKITILENSNMWNDHVKKILLTTNLPIALLHPVELETEEGNYFPVTPKEFSVWLQSNRLVR